MKNLTINVILLTTVLFLNCSYILNSEAQNPAQPDEVTLLPPTKIYATAVLLSWTKPKSENFAAYKIYYDTNQGVTDKSPLAATITFKDDTSYLLDSLDESTKYYVKVFVHNSGSYSESKKISFTTIPCNCGPFTGEKQDGMILIPAGCFVGKDGSIAAISHDYYMDTTEVTITEWNNIMSTASIIDTTEIPLDKWNYILNFDTLNSLKPKTEMSWYQMIVYCNERSIKNNKDICYTYKALKIDTSKSKIYGIESLECNFTENGFRLPTEDEWEYACRAGCETEYFWGKDGNTLMVHPYTSTYPKTTEDTAEISEYVWWSYNNDPSGSKEVAQKKPNNWQLYDMIGNVEEAVWDIADTTPRGNNRIDYTGPKLEPQTTRRAITRVGSYRTSKCYSLTVWWRKNNMDFDNIDNTDVGFRVVCTKVP